MSVNVNVVVDGRSNQKINHNGNTYLPVENGKEFELKIENNNNYKVVAVVSVDGINVIDASVADYNGRGYIIQPRKTLNIKGWRHSQEEVSKFTFVDRSNGAGYADKLGRGKDTGVIGVAIFKEKEVKIEYVPTPFIPIDTPNPWKKEGPKPWAGEPWVQPARPYDPYQPYPTVIWQSTTCSTRGMSSGLEHINNVAPADSYNYVETKTTKSIRPQNTQESAVGRGDKVESRTHTVEFNREAAPERVIVLYYDTVDGLRAKGVPIDQYIGKPNPFPAQPVNYYCPEV